jgi:hypothetical protein
MEKSVHLVYVRPGQLIHDVVDDYRLNWLRWRHGYRNATAQHDACASRIPVPAPVFVGHNPDNLTWTPERRRRHGVAAFVFLQRNQVLNNAKPNLAPLRIIRNSVYVPTPAKSLKYNNITTP